MLALNFFCHLTVQVANVLENPELVAILTDPDFKKTLSEMTDPAVRPVPSLTAMQN